MSAAVLSPVIELAFTARNAELVRLRLKRSTVRRHQHGRVGSEFVLGGERFRIVAISRCELGKAASDFFFLEGESSPISFLEWWARSYGFNADTLDLRQIVYVHLFLPVLPGHEPFGVTS